DYPVVEVAWARMTFNVLFLIVLFRRRLGAVLSSAGPGRQLMRSLLMGVVTIFIFASLHLVPLANFTAIMFLAPIIVTALSMPLLGERVGPHRWAAVLIGFAGALIIVRPDVTVFQPAAVVPLVTATLLALYYISTRWISRVDDAMTTLVYTPLVGAGMFSLAVPFFWVAPDLNGWLLMAATGLLGLGAHFALIKAFEAAPAATVTPFNYLGLIWAIVLGFTVFSHLPDGWTLLGAAIIVAGGLYIFHREQRSG
ncbi:MAG: DMT family transporter, partial [Rhodospirillales bacterium]|nr:DMT family transporter [Rhodospirillales bacterium]